jgi:hypothetical protein
MITEILYIHQSQVSNTLEFKMPLLNDYLWQYFRLINLRDHLAIGIISIITNFQLNRISQGQSLEIIIVSQANLFLKEIHSNNLLLRS